MTAVRAECEDCGLQSTAVRAECEDCGLQSTVVRAECEDCGRESPRCAPNVRIVASSFPQAQIFGRIQDVHSAAGFERAHSLPP